MAIGDKIPVEAIKKMMGENPLIKWAAIAIIVAVAGEMVVHHTLGIMRELILFPNTIQAEYSESINKKAGAIVKAGSSPEELEQRREKERERVAKALSQGAPRPDDPTAKTRRCALRKKFDKDETRRLGELERECANEAQQ